MKISDQQGNVGGPDGERDTVLTLSREGIVVGTVNVLAVSSAALDTAAEWNALLIV